MFTDIVGYTAMMQQNEAEGMAKAKRFRTTMQNMVSQYRRELLEIRGDGSQSVFNSAIDAVTCAKEIQENLLKRFKKSSAYQIAQVYAHRGEIDESFKWLERSFEQYDPGTHWAPTDNMLKNLHDDPRWGPFVAKIR